MLKYLSFGLILFTLIACGGGESDKPATVGDIILPSTPIISESNTVIAYDSIALQWSASSDNVAISHYLVYRDGGATAIAQVSTTQYIDINLELGVTYRYTISAVDTANNESALSEAASFTTLLDTEPPTTPANLSASNITGNSVSLNWHASTDNHQIMGYRLYRDGQTTPLADVTNNHYTDATLSPANNYEYTVTAYDAAGNESAHSDNLTVATLPLLSNPFNLEAPFPASNGAFLLWQPVDGALSYTVFANGGEIDEIINAPRTYSYKWDNAIAEHDYIITVQANLANNETAKSEIMVTTTQPINLANTFPDGTPYPWPMDDNDFIDRSSLIVSGSSNENENTVIKYISISGDDDNHSGDTELQAWKTPLKAIDYLREATNRGATPRSIHLLFKKGDSFDIDRDDFLLQYIRGYSPENPIFIGSYGNGPRPLFIPTSYDGNGIRTESNRPAGVPMNIIVQGLDFYHKLRDPNSDLWVDTLGYVESQDLKSAFAFNMLGKWIVIEDCRFQYFGGGRGASMVEQNLLNPESRPEYSLLRRNIIRYNWGNQSIAHSQGFFTQWSHNMVLEENLFDHNVWLADPANPEYPHPSTPNAYPNKFSHEIYLQYRPFDIVVRNNIIARASNFGIQARSGGHIDNNLILKSPVAIMIANSGSVTNNTVLYGRDLTTVDTNSADYQDNNYFDSYQTDNYMKIGHGWGIQSLWYHSALIKNNIVAHKTAEVSPGFSYLFEEGEPGIENGTLGTSLHQSHAQFEKNIAYNFGLGVRVSNFASLNAQQNLISASMDSNAILYSVINSNYSTNHTWNTNYYSMANGTSLITNYNGESATDCLSAVSLLLDTTAYCNTPLFSDPDRNIESYQTSRGKTANLVSFLDEVAAREAGTFDPSISAIGVQQYIRDGFNNAIFNFE